MKYIVIFLSLCVLVGVSLAAYSKFKTHLVSHPHAHLKTVALKHTPYKTSPFLNK